MSDTNVIALKPKARIVPQETIKSEPKKPAAGDNKRPAADDRAPIYILMAYIADEMNVSERMVQAIIKTVYGLDHVDKLHGNVIPNAAVQKLS